MCVYLSLYMFESCCWVSLGQLTWKLKQKKINEDKFVGLDALIILQLNQF